MNIDIDKYFFTNYWHLVGHRRELLQHNDYIKFLSPIGEIVIFNYKNELIAFDNLCPHRGNRIYKNRYGNNPPTCSYHGWHYLDGKFNPPDNAQFMHCNTADVTHNSYLIDWCGDFVFISISPSYTLSEQLGSTGEMLENISFNIESRVDFNYFDFKCYWPIAIENALEPYHIPMIHKNTLAKLELSDGINLFNNLNSVWNAPIDNSSVVARLKGIHKFFNIDYSFEGYQSIYLFPFTMLSSTFGYSYSLQNFFPAQDSLKYTNFTSRLYGVPLKSDRAMKILMPFIESTANVNRMVFDEDHEICKGVDSSCWNLEPLKFWSKSEEKIIHFRNNCKKELSKISIN